MNMGKIEHKQNNTKHNKGWTDGDISWGVLLIWKDIKQNHHRD